LLRFALSTEQLGSSFLSARPRLETKHCPRYKPRHRDGVGNFTNVKPDHWLFTFLGKELQTSEKSRQRETRCREMNSTAVNVLFD
jgi:hypothetical protein